MARNPYITSSATEADLRLELRNMFHGSGQEVAKSHQVLLRRMRRDVNDHLLPCPCVDPITREPDIDTKCEFCLGEGFFWDEEWVKCRSIEVGSSSSKLVLQNEHAAPGVLSPDLRVFYFEYNVNPTWYDRVVEVKYNLDGTARSPVQRHKVYKPHTVRALKGDNGRIEFFAVYCTQKDAIFIDQQFNK
jgi:hypothetical protein